MNGLFLANAPLTEEAKGLGLTAELQDSCCAVRNKIYYKTRGGAEAEKTIVCTNNGEGDNEKKIYLHGVHVALGTENLELRSGADVLLVPLCEEHNTSLVMGQAIT